MTGFGIKICDWKVSQLILFKEQSHPGRHLHFHLVPKYKGEFEWTTVFAMNPGKTYLSEEEYAAMIEKIKAAL